MLAPLPIADAAAIVLRAETPHARHNVRATTGSRVTLTTVHCAAQAAQARRFTCTLRAYSGPAGHRRRELRLEIAAVIVPRHTTRVFEDYSGWIRVDTTRSLYLNPAA